MGAQENLPKLLNTILNSFMDLCDCDGGSIFTLRKDAHGQSYLAFEIMATRSIKIFQVPEHLKNMDFRLDGTTLVGRSATELKFLKQRFDLKGPEKATTEGATKVNKALGNYQTHTILSGPLVTPRGDLVGVVQLLNKLPTEPGEEAVYPDFNDKDERLLGIVAGQAALAIENSMLLEEQEKLIEGFVNACVTAVEARDPVTSGHSQRVCDYTVGLAEAVNRTSTGALGKLTFNDNQLREIRFAAMLHDIGKISVREHVLNKEKKLLPHQLEVIRMRLKLMRANLRLHMVKTGMDLRPQISRLEDAWKTIGEANEPSLMPSAVTAALHELQGFEVLADDGEKIQAVTDDEIFKLSIMKGSLTTDERVEIERHVTNTWEILRMVPWSRGLEGVPEIAYKHHEKLDGTGYPLKCTEPQIPVQSRMLTICDIYDALTADDRPYKKAVPIEKALGILKMEVTQKKLDPELFQIFVESKTYEIALPQKRRKAA